MGLESGPKRRSPEQGDLFDDIDSLKQYSDVSSPEFKNRLVDLAVAAIEKQRADDIFSDSAHVTTDKLFDRIAKFNILAPEEFNKLKWDVVSAVTTKLNERDVEKKQKEMADMAGKKFSQELDKRIAAMPEEGISEEEQRKKWWQWT